MSLFSAFTEGWSFRTSTPSFEPGTEITAFVTGRENGTYIARIGDTVLQVAESNDTGARTDAGDEDGADAGESDGDTDTSRDDEQSPDGGGTDLVDTKVRLRVEEFSENDHTGRATVLERLGDGSF